MKPYERAGFGTPYAYRKARAEARAWSNEHSRVKNSRYSRGLNPEKFGAYYRAYVSKASGLTASKARSVKSRRWLKNYLVKVAKVMTADEFDRRYPIYS